MAASLDDALSSAMKAALDEALAPYLRRLADPEPLVYTVPQAAKVLATSDKTVRRLIKEGHLATVPHMEGRVVIPRTSVQALVDSGLPLGIRVAS